MISWSAGWFNAVGFLATVELTRTLGSPILWFHFVLLAVLSRFLIPSREAAKSRGANRRVGLEPIRRVALGPAKPKN
jgi:hypothetical protein